MRYLHQRLDYRWRTRSEFWCLLGRALPDECSDTPAFLEALDLTEGGKLLMSIGCPGAGWRKFVIYISACRPASTFDELDFGPRRLRVSDSEPTGDRQMVPTSLLGRSCG
jgi:hypothetical protein